MGGGGGKGKGGDAPEAPDYAAAAQQTAQGNLEAARVATKANRVNQYTPYGNLIYTQGGGAPTFDQAGYDRAMQAYKTGGGAGASAGSGWDRIAGMFGAPQGGGGGVAPNAADFWRTQGDPDRWSSQIELSPTGQQLLDYSNTAQLGLGKQTGQALERVDQTLSKPFDYGSVGALSDEAYRQNTARLDPEWAQREGQFNQQMANQGITAGGEAYNNASRNFGQQRNDAYSQARRDAFALMPQTFQLSNALRSQPLNELNALRTGSQVTNPTFTPVPQQQTTPGANMLGAAQAQYGADQANYQSQLAGNNAFMGGLFSLGGAALGSPWLGGKLGF